MAPKLTLALAALAALTSGCSHARPTPARSPLPEPPPPAVMTRCVNADARDQDDVAIWVHPVSPSASLLVASDKAAHRIFLYDLDGALVHAEPVKDPGNVDLRRGFLLGGEAVDLVVASCRRDARLLAWKLDVAGRRLARVDDGTHLGGDHEGGTLFRSPKTGRLYFVATSTSGRVEQFELEDNGRGRVTARSVRRWRIGKCEGAVADDRTGRLYVAEENACVWELGGEPEDPAPGRRAIRLGEHGLVGDIEGLAIWRLPDGRGYLVVSNQGADDFKVYRLGGEHEFVGTFRVHGAARTDGLEICQENLAPRFPRGVFAFHTARTKPCPVLVVGCEEIASNCDGAIDGGPGWEIGRR